MLRDTVLVLCWIVVSLLFRMPLSGDVDVLDAFQTKLGVSMTSVERIHRIGRKRNGFCRPVILRLFDLNKNKNILKNCKKLKGSHLSTACDYIKDTLDKRRLFWKSAEPERASGEKGLSGS